MGLIFHDPYELSHHGIRGMKWGIQNGPPYPLGESDHSPAERKIGSDSKGSSRIPLRDSSLKKLSAKEKLKDSLNAVNPYYASEAGKMNCLSCSLAGTLRRLGYDAKAKPWTEGVYDQTVDGFTNLFEEKDVRFVDSSWFNSYDRAKKVISEAYGTDDAVGLCTVYWKGFDDGHAFCWQFKNGDLSFMDFQSGENNVDYFSAIADSGKPEDDVGLVRINEDTPIDMERLSEYVDIKS